MDLAEPHGVDGGQRNAQPDMRMAATWTALVICAAVSGYTPATVRDSPGVSLAAIPGKSWLGWHRTVPLTSC